MTHIVVWFDVHQCELRYEVFDSIAHAEKFKKKMKPHAQFNSILIISIDKPKATIIS